MCNIRRLLASNYFKVMDDIFGTSTASKILDLNSWFYYIYILKVFFKDGIFVAIIELF